MKKHLNTLFVTQPDVWLGKDGETVVIKKEGKVVYRLPLHLLQSIVCFGDILLSPQLMAHCAKLGITITFLSPYGRFYARVEGPVSGNVLLRRTQYRWADDPEMSTRIARSILFGKIANARVVLQRTARDHPSVQAELKPVVNEFASVLKTLTTISDLDQLRGIEGKCAAYYFDAFPLMIRTDQFEFHGRSRRPPRDEVNALLSFVYTLLVHDVRSALETVGLDPQVGFLHRDRPGRPGLALDLMEELRSFFADRLVLSLINRKQLSRKDFTFHENGAVLLHEESRKVVITAYQERKKDELRHPFLGEKCTVGAIPFIQAMLLARFLRGDLDDYPPFLWK